LGVKTAVRGLFLAAVLAPATLAANEEVFPLHGAWRFSLDPEDVGLREKWFAPERTRGAWREVLVPHTWQVEPASENFLGVAWYARAVEPEPTWTERTVHLEFDAVNRDAQVWLNGAKVGEHVGSGYTPFSFALDGKWNAARTNELIVRVDNRFSTNALPYSNSFDWPVDGGIIRAVRLRVAPRTHLRRVIVQTEPSADFSVAAFDARIEVETSSGDTRGLTVDAVAFDPEGRVALGSSATPTTGATGEVEARLRGTISRPMLWHFDQPRRYRLVCRLTKDGAVVHQREVAFGIRKVEVRPGFFLLNGEPMRLMGVEWMPGSDPRHGLAEDPRLAQEVLADMKRLNCVLTRFHWQQDESVFEFCDREGILVQEEVPAWGNFKLDGPELPALQERHLREMILAHANHPSIFAWGLCNEIKGLSPAGRAFVQRGQEIARALDPLRLLTYASNTLHYRPERDAARLLDFIEWNEYFETWYPGELTNLPPKLNAIQQAYPDKGVVISEYGLCECHERHPTGDEHRVELLRSHTAAYRQNPAVAGAIFFSYNDYRTHMGDKGQGAFQQRIHGVVDLLGRRKPSWEALRREASPIRSLTVEPPVNDGNLTRARVRLVTRALADDLPAYTLRGYRLVWTAHDRQDHPLGTGSRVLPDLVPGSVESQEVIWPAFDELRCIRVQVFRPTGYPVIDAEWLAERL
jgi:beta-glucuronidase